MYDLINQFAKTVVATIPHDHITDYEWLIKNTGQANTAHYQERYRSFWAMNAARLSPDFYTAYFSLLGAAIDYAPTLKRVISTLYDASSRLNGTKSLQFSFATKLLHMTNPHLPMYDSQVAAFYFFVAPTTSAPDPERRTSEYLDFYQFLTSEYARVLQNGLLRRSIEEFRHRLKPQHFTDEKIIDSLIWGFVKLLRNGALSNRRIIYR